MLHGGQLVKTTLLKFQIHNALICPAGQSKRVNGFSTRAPDRRPLGAVHQAGVSTDASTSIRLCLHISPEITLQWSAMHDTLVLTHSGSPRSVAGMQSKGGVAR